MALSNKIGNIFDFIPETNITEEYLYNHSGEYPVYSGQTESEGVIGYIGSYNQESPCVTFTTYGSAGKLFYREGKYTIGRNCMGLRPKEKYAKQVNLKWFKFAFQNLFYRLRIGDVEGQRSLNKLLLKRQLIVIPDMTIQQKQLDKYQYIESLKYHLSSLMRRTSDLGHYSIEYPLTSIIAEDKLSVFMKFVGGNSGLTEEFIYDNYPESEVDSIEILTSATLEREAMGAVSQHAKISGKKLKIFESPAVLVARNGYAGTMTYIPEGRFTTNDHAYVLTVKKDWKAKISLEWFLCEYQGLFFKLVTSKSDNATFNKEYAEKQTIRIPYIDYQNAIVKKVNQVGDTIKKLHRLENSTESLLEYAIT